MVETDAFNRFTSVEFKRFKAFSSFRIDLKHFNILVGPNNCGKSTVLTAFRILASAMRLANARNPVEHILELETEYEHTHQTGRI